MIKQPTLSYVLLSALCLLMIGLAVKFQPVSPMTYIDPEILEIVQEVLENDSILDFIGFPLPGVTAVRPIWENQVMSPDELHPGQVLMMMGGWENKIIIMSETYTQDGKCVYDAVLIENTSYRSEYYNTWYCSDNGLVPYENGMWNLYNYLTYTGQPDLSPEEVSNMYQILTHSP